MAVPDLRLPACPGWPAALCWLKPSAFPLVRLGLETEVRLRLPWRQNSAWLSSECKTRGKSTSSTEVITWVKLIPDLLGSASSTCPSIARAVLCAAESLSARTHARLPAAVP